MLDVSGKFMPFIITLRDITSEENAAKALRISEKKQRALIDNSLVGIYKSTVKGEVEYVNNGYGEKRHNIMYNDFVIVGPVHLDTETLEDTLSVIKEDYNFYSRGDNSGTHVRELSIWEEYDYDVSSFGDWYNETGQGMGATLSMTSLSGYFTMSDRATFYAMKDNLDLVIAYENKEELENQYGIILVNPDLHNRDTEYAELFYNWIIREDIQELISTYIIDDEQLFYPNS